MAEIASIEIAKIEPILNTDTYTGQLVYNNQPLNYKAVIEDNRVIAIVNKRFKVIPHSIVDDLAEQIIKEYNMYTDDRFTGYRRYGAMYFRTLYSTEERTINDESFRVGLLLTNSYLGNAALKAEISLLRMICSNGMFFPYRLGTIRAVHLGKGVEDTVLKFSMEVDELTSNIDKISEILKRMAEVNLNENMVKQLLHYVTPGVLRMIDIPITVERSNGKVSYSISNFEPRSVYDVYNQLTDIYSNKINIGINRVIVLRHIFNTLTKNLKN